VFDLLETDAMQPGLKRSLELSLRLLTPRERRRYWLLVISQTLTSLLDLAGVVLLGLLIFGLVNGADSTAQTGVVPSGVAADMAERPAVWLVAGAALFVAKSVCYAAILRATTRFLASCQSRAATRGTTALFHSRIEAVEGRSSQDYAFAVTQGYYQAVTSVLSSFAIVLTEAVLVSVIILALLLVDPLVTVVAVVSFGSVGLASHRWLGRWSTEVGTAIRTGTVRSFQSLQETLLGFREMTILRRQNQRVTLISDALDSTAQAQGASTFIFQAPKIVYESALVAIGIGLVVWQAQTRSSAEVLATMSFFLVASSRMIPSLLRLNAQLASMRAAAAQARTAVELDATADVVEARALPEQGLGRSQSGGFSYEGFRPVVECRDITYRYPDTSSDLLDRISFTVGAGERAAIVGATGSGKSTVADLLLGIRTPDRGQVLISDLPPNAALDRWPGAVAYVPQRVGLLAGSVRENVCMGLDPHEAEDVDVWRVLQEVRLADLFSTTGDGLDSIVGEHGMRLSGGQRQRLGLARALLSRPRLLILDEATSALDGETELAIAEALEHLHREVTIVSIAHRYASIRDADVYVYLEDGTGHVAKNLDQLADECPGFRRQFRPRHLNNAPGHGPTDQRH
jgi:ABC-type multidrug transport system fused ATPase/permease subunit